MKTSILLFSAALLCAQSAKVDVISNAEMERMEKKISGQKIGSESLARYSNSSMQLTRRETSGVVELHQNKADIFYVRAGEATLVEGGTVNHPKTTAPHEIRGESITGGSRHALGAGDLVHIPAGVPHQLLLAPGKTFTYIAFKIDQ